MLTVKDEVGRNGKDDFSCKRDKEDAAHEVDPELLFAVVLELLVELLGGLMQLPSVAKGSENQGAGKEKVDEFTNEVVLALAI